MKYLVPLFLLFLLPAKAFPGGSGDSLVYFHDLKFHSGFEHGAFLSFLTDPDASFDLFLAIDETMDSVKAARYHKSFNGIIQELESQAIASKKMNKKIKMAYSGIHSKYMKKYNDYEYFPVLFEEGTYNCVSASMLFSLVFDRIDIPYKIMASSDHVYLIANPGEKSVVIETTNPGFEQTIFSGEFKQQYVNYLRSSKLISEEEYRNKSMDEIFQEKFKEVKDAEFSNLPGFQYHNKALMSFQNMEYKSAYELAQKAYFFFPENQTRILLGSSLIALLDQCTYKHVEDIDYLAQVSRFNEADINSVNALFNTIIQKNLQYTGREPFCDSIYSRLVEQVSNRELRDELTFTFNILMSYHHQLSDDVEKYIGKALDIQGNNWDAIQILQNHLVRKFSRIHDPEVLVDTVVAAIRKFPYQGIKLFLEEIEILSYLDAARLNYKKGQVKKADEYLARFEEKYNSESTTFLIAQQIEDTYLAAAIYYFGRNYVSKAKAYLKRGLEYAPNSYALKHAIE